VNPLVAVFWLGVVFVYLTGTFAGWFGMFTKAGEPGWTAFIPGYNLIVLMRLAGISEWWALLFLVPFVNLGFWVVVCDQLSIKFGKGIGTTLGLTWLGFLFNPLLGFGDAAYERTAVPARQRRR
jgi:hypothetical protein